LFPFVVKFGITIWRAASKWLDNMQLTLSRSFRHYTVFTQSNKQETGISTLPEINKQVT